MLTAHLEDLNNDDNAKPPTFIITNEFTYIYTEEIRGPKEIDKQSIDNIISYIKNIRTLLRKNSTRRP